MSEYQINPRNKAQPYMTVSLDDKRPDTIALGLKGGKYKVLLDALVGAELVTAINDLCRESGYAYIPNLGEQR